jgi:Fe2+ or Zn2+ uptake regulation protein
MNTHKAPNTEEFKVLLKKHDLKATRQRIAVHEAMLAIGHASADMVTEEIRKRGDAKVTVASVYNILSQLADIRIYHRRYSSNSKMYFDVNTFKHMHLYDRENNSYRDVLDEEFMDALYARLKRRKFKGYTIEDIDIQFICRPTAHKAKAITE